MTRSSGPVEVFDPALLRARLRRAARQGGANFLMQGLTDDLLDRLSMVRRNFANVVDAGSPDDIRPRLRTLLPDARLFRISAVPAVNEETDSDQYVIGNEMLPTLPAPIDLVVSLLAFQTVNDLPGVLVQIARALQPDGLLIAALLGGQTLHELRTAFAMAESDLTGGASPRVSPFADVRDMGALLQRAGFALPVADSETLTVRYADPVGLLQDLRAMGGTSILTERLHTPMRRELLTRAMDVYRREFSDPDGRVRATFEIIWISGWRPHESQQNPLKPGSALARLTDVLPTKTYD